MKTTRMKFLIGFFGAMLSGTVSAGPPATQLDNNHCSTPLLYATNIRNDCAQYGDKGLDTLYQSSAFIDGLMNKPRPEKAQPKAEARS